MCLRTRSPTLLLASKLAIMFVLITSSILTYEQTRLKTRQMPYCNHGT